MAKCGLSSAVIDLSSSGSKSPPGTVPVLSTESMTSTKLDSSCQKRKHVDLRCWPAERNRERRSFFSWLMPYPSL